MENEKELIAEFEKGHRITQLIHSAGYADLLDIFEQEVIENEFRLMNAPLGTDNILLRDLHVAARVSRSIFERIQLRLQAATQASLEALSLSQRPQSEYSEAQFTNL